MDPGYQFCLGGSTAADNTGAGTFQVRNDDIVGILYVKDIFFLDEDEFSAETYMREPLFTYESKPVAELLAEMKKSRLAVAIVLDEYGGTSGLVTMEDMVEEILSEYKDSLESAYRKALVHHIGIFGIASNMYEEKLKKENSMEVFNESGIQDYGNAWEDNYVDDDLWTLVNLTSEDVEKTIKEKLNRDDY